MKYLLAVMLLTGCAKQERPIELVEALVTVPVALKLGAISEATAKAIGDMDNKPVLVCLYDKNAKPPIELFCERTP